MLSNSGTATTGATRAGGVVRRVAVDLVASETTCGSRLLFLGDAIAIGRLARMMVRFLVTVTVRPEPGVRRAPVPDAREALELFVKLLVDIFGKPDCQGAHCEVLLVDGLRGKRRCTSGEA